MKLAVLIPAAGEGRRLGKGPKALLPLGDKTILEQTVAAFEGLVSDIRVAVSDTMLKKTQQLLPNVSVVLGAGTRQETVYNLLQATDAQYVLIHDAARPFLEVSIFNAVVESLKSHPAVSVAKGVADSLIFRNTGETLERSQLAAVQTPQAFHLELITEAHDYAKQMQLTATDDAALVRLLGQDVKLVDGSSWLDKITTPADYERAQALVEVWRARP